VWKIPLLPSKLEVMLPPYICARTAAHQPEYHSPPQTSRPPEVQMHVSMASIGPLLSETLLPSGTTIEVDGCTHCPGGLKRVCQDTLGTRALIQTAAATLVHWVSCPKAIVLRLASLSIAYMRAIHNLVKSSAGS
jgi:hypothetical protein